MSPNKSFARQLDEFIDNDIAFDRECRWEAENPPLPEQIELFEEVE